MTTEFSRWRFAGGGAQLLLGVSFLYLVSCGEKQSITRADEPVRQAATGSAPAVLSLSVNPGTVSAGASATGTVTLTGPAPSGGTAVGVSSNNTAAATVPPTVTVPAGSSTASFTVTTHPVASDDWAAISATAGQVTQTAVLNVLASGLTLSALTVSPTLIAGGAMATGTVTLTGAAPAGGAVVALTSGDATIATVPASVTVAAGATSATFTVTAKTIAFASSVLISASFGGVTRAMWVTVTEPAPTGRQLSALTIAQNTVVGGTPVQGTVTLASAVGGATVVTLASTDVSVATVPASVTVPSGVASATFTITTLPVTSVGFAVISAQAGSVERSVSLTTLPPPTGPTLISVVFFPARVGGGGPVTGRVKFNGPATQGAQVSLTSSNPNVVQVPATIVVIKNASSADFPVTTSAVGANVNVTVSATACCGGLGSANGVLTVTTDPPPPPDVVRIDKAEFKPGGRGGTLTVRATSTSATAILTVFRNASTVPTFVLTNQGGGRYQGSFSFSGTKPATVTVRSNLGGVATAKVN